MKQKEQQDNSHFGAVVGLTVMGLMYGLGSISGGAFNLASASGLVITGIALSSDYWLYILGNLLGAAIAMTVVQVLERENA